MMRRTITVLLCLFMFMFTSAQAAPSDRLLREFLPVWPIADVGDALPAATIN